jgi:enamine deaminase RidA (YjgF/YER057c/UK114 family)
VIGRTAAAPRAPAIARGPEESPSTPVQTRRVASREFVEIHVCSRPERFAGDFAAQARSMYENLFGELAAEGARPADIVTEKVFFDDIGAEIHELQKIRREFYRQDGTIGAPRPAATFIQQPPAHPGQLCEVQAFALLPADLRPLSSRAMEGLPATVSGRVIETDGVRHVFLANLTGGSPGDGRRFTRQAAAVYQRAEACLRRERLSFRDVVRTWIYLRDIERDYGSLNRVRREFFRRRGVHPAPASTGIQGGPYPGDRRCALDLHAAGGGEINVRTIHAATMNEAPEYGSDFARGMRVGLKDRAIIYISGTASIDLEGRVVGVGGIEGQVDRMLLNVEQLLEGQGASYADLVSAVTYLKKPEYRRPFLEVGRRRGLPDRIPNTLCVADVCRPEWLCEIEATAVVA